MFLTLVQIRRSDRTESTTRSGRISGTRTLSCGAPSSTDSLWTRLRARGPSGQSGGGNLPVGRRPGQATPSCVVVSVLPEPLEPIRGQLRVPHRVLNVPMAKIVGTPNAGSTSPAVLDSSLCAVVPRLVTSVLAGIGRHVVVTDYVEVLARFLVVDLAGQCSDHTQVTALTASGESDPIHNPTSLTPSLIDGPESTSPSLRA